MRRVVEILVDLFLRESSFFRERGIVAFAVLVECDDEVVDVL